MQSVMGSACLLIVFYAPLVICTSVFLWQSAQRSNRKAIAVGARSVGGN